MAKDINPPRGMRDFLPSEKARRESVLSVIRDIYARHGFDEIETPVMEDYDRLHAGLGGDNEKLAFSVLKRGLNTEAFSAVASSGELSEIADLGLRFDLTVPLARFYATHRAELPSVFRALHIGSVWRAERPQKGRYRQFVQCDIDIMGEHSQLAEVELITATSDVLKTLGLGECTIRVNDRRILNSILDYCGFNKERYSQVMISIDKLDKIGVSAVVDELSETGADAAAVLGGLLNKISPHLSQGGVPMTVKDILSVIPEGINPDAVADLETLAHNLTSLPEGVQVRFDPTLVRGMGYYTGTIFEISHPQSGSSVGGGGRYDGMIGRFLGQNVPAAGFSIGFERIIDLVEKTYATSQEAVVLVHDALLDEADVSLGTLLKIKTELIAQGKRVRLEKRVKNLTPLLDRLRDEGFGSFAFVSQETHSAKDLVFKELT